MGVDGGRGRGKSFYTTSATKKSHPSILPNLHQRTYEPQLSSHQLILPCIVSTARVYTGAMEEDRALTDLGIAADIEEAQRQAEQSISSTATSSTPADTETEAQSQQPATRQPKKRFVGRRAADAAAAAQNAGSDATASSTAVGRELTSTRECCVDFH